MHAELLAIDYGTSFWGSILSIVKLNPDGDWIKLLFSSTDPNGGPDSLGTVKVALYESQGDGQDPTWKEQSVDIGSLPTKGAAGEYTDALYVTHSSEPVHPIDELAGHSS